MLLDSISKIFPIFICWWEIQTYTGLFVHKVTYTRYDIPWFIEQMDLSLLTELIDIHVNSAKVAGKRSVEEIRSFCSLHSTEMKRWKICAKDIFVNTKS
jgi:hypothetical protein